MIIICSVSVEEDIYTQLSPHSIVCRHVCMCMFTCHTINPDVFIGRDYFPANYYVIVIVPSHTCTTRAHTHTHTHCAHTKSLIDTAFLSSLQAPFEVSVALVYLSLAMQSPRKLKRLNLSSCFTLICAHFSAHSVIYADENSKENTFLDVVLTRRLTS